MKKIFILLITAISIFSQELYYEDDISVKEAYEMQKKGAILIDVRTASEYIYASHPVGAISIPIFEYRFNPKNINLRVNFAKKEINKANLDAQKLYEIIPIENKNFLEDVKKVVKKLGNRAILIICRSGARSKYAANLLSKNGFNNVYNVEEGFLGWKKEKLPYKGE